MQGTGAQQPKKMPRGKPFEPGDPRINRDGRPKRKPITDALLAALAETSGRAKRSKADQGARKLVQLFLKGDIQAAKLILAYVEGLPRQPVDVTIRQEAERIAGATGADPDWLLRRAEEIAEEAVGA